ncbi:hypothetical protein [Rhodopirellula baltica]
MSNRLFCGCCGCPGDSVVFYHSSQPGNINWQDAFVEDTEEPGRFVSKKTLPESWLRLDFRSILPYNAGSVAGVRAFFDDIDHLDSESEVLNRQIRATLVDPDTESVNFELVVFVQKTERQNIQQATVTNWEWITGPTGDGRWYPVESDPFDVVRDEFQVVLRVNGTELPYVSTTALSSDPYLVPGAPQNIYVEDTPFHPDTYYPPTSDEAAHAVIFPFFEIPDFWFWDDSIEMSWSPQTSGGFALPNPVDDVADTDRVRFSTESPVGKSKLIIESSPSLTIARPTTRTVQFAWNGITNPAKTKNTSCQEVATCSLVPPYYQLPYMIGEWTFDGVSSYDTNFRSINGCGTTISLDITSTDDPNDIKIDITGEDNAANLAAVSAADVGYSNVGYFYYEPTSVLLALTMANSSLDPDFVTLTMGVSVEAWWPLTYILEQWPGESGYVEPIDPTVDSHYLVQTTRSFQIAKEMNRNSLAGVSEIEFSGAGLASMSFGRSTTPPPFSAVWPVRIADANDVRDIRITLEKDDLAL